MIKLQKTQTKFPKTQSKLPETQTKLPKTKKGYKNMPKSLIKLQSHKQNWPKFKKKLPKIYEIVKSADLQKCAKIRQNYVTNLKNLEIFFHRNHQKPIFTSNPIFLGIYFQLRRA